MMYQLGDVLDLGGKTPWRVSFYGILLFAKRSKASAVGQNSGAIWTLYVTDGYLQRKMSQGNKPHNHSSRNCCYVKTSVLSSHVLDDNEESILTGRSGVRLFMKDLVFSSGNNGKDASMETSF